MTSRHKSKIQATVGVMPLLMLLSLAMCFSGGCAQNESSTTDVAAAAPSTKTEEELLREINRKFENPRAHYELARFYHRSGQWTKAESRYDQTLSFQPGFVAAQAGMVKLYVDQGERAKAEQFANSYIRQASGNTDANLRLAWEFEALGLSDYAMRCLTQALTEAPDSAEANKQMGLYYLDKGDKERARQYLTRSIDLDPYQPDVSRELGLLGVVVEIPGLAEEPEEEAPDR